MKKKIMIALCIGVMSMALGGCSTNTESKKEEKSAVATEDEKTKLFRELNAAANKSATQEHFRVDTKTPNASIIACENGELVERKLDSYRTITDYDFANHRVINHVYLFEDPSDPKISSGFATATWNGKTVTIPFTEIKGLRNYDKGDEPVSDAEAILTVNDFNGVVRDEEHDVFAIKKEKNEDGFLYTLTLEDVDKFADYQKEIMEKSGENFYSWDSCQLKQRKTTDFLIKYHVNTEGYLLKIDNHITIQLDDKTLKQEYTMEYGTYHQLGLGPFEKILTEES